MQQRPRPAWGLAIAISLIVVPALVRAQVTPLGSEFRINTFTTGEQRQPEVSAAANGDFVTVWEDYGRDGSSSGVFGQRFDSSGTAVGTDFQINTYTTDAQGQYRLDVASGTNGDFIVVWDSRDQDGSGVGIFGQLYASSGNVIGSEFQINSYTTGDQTRAAVAAANNTFVVVWESLGQLTPGENDVFAQRYDSGGGALGSEFRVNTSTTGYQYGPEVAGMNNGDFVVVWGSFEISNGSYGDVFAQRFVSNGNPAGTEFEVNTYTPSTSGGASPSVAVAPNRTFVISWNNSADQDGSDVGIFARRYDSGGSPQGTEFQVNTYTTGGQFRSAVAATDNDFVIVWDGFDQDGAQLGVFGQRFATTGAPAGTEFQVNTYTFGHQDYNAIAFTNGDFIVVWQSGGFQDGDFDGIFAQRLALAVPQPEDCPIVPLATCTSPGKSLLLIKDTNADGASADDKLLWKWLKGPVTTQGLFGNPTATADYRLCVYSGGAETLTLKATLPAAGTCDSQPCWKFLGTKGFKRKDKAAVTDGISLVLLKSGAADKSKIIVKGKDATLDLSSATLPFDSLNNVRVQLSNTDNSNCWEGIFTPASFKKNVDDSFKAKTVTP